MATTVVPSHGSPSSPQQSGARVTLWGGRFLLSLWAVFWLWFHVESAITESERTWAHIDFAAVVAALTAASWCWPRVGGVLMILAGAFSAWMFNVPTTLVLLAAPALIIGVVLLFSER